MIKNLKQIALKSFLILNAFSCSISYAQEFDEIKAKLDGGIKIVSPENTNCDCTEGVPNFSFKVYNLSNIFLLDSYYQQAYNYQLKQWFNAQKTIMEAEMEGLLKDDFSSYDNARKAFYKHQEDLNLRRYRGGVLDDYNEDIATTKTVKDQYLNNLKLLNFWDDLSATGKAQYGHLKGNSTRPTGSRRKAHSGAARSAAYASHTG